MTVPLTLKSQGARAFHRAGGFRLLHHFLGKQKSFVLMYHRVLDSLERESVFVQPGMYVRTQTFRQHIAYLKANFQVIPVRELIERVSEHKTTHNCCSITFDDGWLDNYTQAYPILQEFGVPATIFLATGFIGTNRLFWPEEFSHYLRTPLGLTLLRQQTTLLDSIPAHCFSATENEHIDRCILALKSLTVDEREKLLHLLKGACPPPPHERLLMNWEEARHMNNSGLIDFGSHTVNHVILDQVPAPRIREEIGRSCRHLMEHVGAKSELFAYPNGNYNSAIKSILKEHGIKGAVTTGSGWVTSKTDLLEIPRIGMHEDISRSIPLFLSRIFLKGF